jgi:hypothetical protein
MIFKAYLTTPHIKENGVPLYSMYWYHDIAAALAHEDYA